MKSDSSTWTKTMMNNKDFIVFILTHGRPDKLYTLKSLQKQGYTGKVCILIDNEDKTAAEYKKKYGNMVHVFDKKAISDTFDEGDNFEDRRAIIYARNVCFDVAQEKGVRYFIELDDDYTSFIFKFDGALNYKETPIKNLDKTFDSLIDFFKTIPAKSLAMAQNGDFIGGKNSGFASKLKPKRKCMNTFICSTEPERQFRFFGRINEDVNAYTCLGNRGNLFLTVPNVAIIQKQTQSNSGGMTELYLDSGTYVKSFYSIMYSPSCVKISVMGETHRRLHHQVSWKKAVPCILEERLKRTV